MENCSYVRKQREDIRHLNGRSAAQKLGDDGCMCNSTGVRLSVRTLKEQYREKITEHVKWKISEEFLHIIEFFWGFFGGGLWRETQAWLSVTESVGGMW
jgi:hypothetical protein